MACVERAKQATSRHVLCQWTCMHLDVTWPWPLTWEAKAEGERGAAGVVTNGRTLHGPLQHHQPLSSSLCYFTGMLKPEEGRGAAGMVTVMDGPYTGPFNIGNPTEFTMLELAKVVQEVVNPAAEIVFRENTADDPSRRKPDISKARAASHALLSRRRHFWSWRSASPITAQTLDRSKACHSSAILKLRLAFGQGACDGGAWAGSTLSEVQGLMCWGPERQLHCCECLYPTTDQRPVGTLRR